MAKAESIFEPNSQEYLPAVKGSPAPESQSMPAGDSARGESSTLDSITSPLEDSSHSNEDPDETLIPPSQHLGSTPLAGPTTAEVIAARRRHKVTTYKRRRSLRLHPAEDENKLSLRSRQITRSISTPTSTPSCSPVPTHAASKYRKRRRRQPPLKHRLARVARSRLPRNKSQDMFSQLPASMPVESAEEDPRPDSTEDVPSVVPEDEPIAIPEPNVTQRRLAAPQNYTIPDLKDLLNAKPQRFPTVPAEESGAELQRNPLPQFVPPPNNNLHSPRPRAEPKRGRLGRKDMPRLNFVALEAHQEQATGRSSDKRVNRVVELHRVPLVSQAPPVPATSNDHRFDVTPAPPAARVNFLTPGQNRSPSRIFVKGTPEPDDLIPRRYPDIAEGPSFLRVSKSSPVHRARVSDTPSDPASDPVQTPARSLVPMTDLLDNLTRLARSAAQMNNKPSAAVPNRPSLKRTHQATLTKAGHISRMTLETGTPPKARRLE
ncbi:hypothetical protein FRC10_010728 [Ceratobasidium sp. 414]|nr:hypothetical protein FRC10_010728 [Ceratobasidium sp. 414]